MLRPYIDSNKLVLVRSYFEGRRSCPGEHNRHLNNSLGTLIYDGYGASIPAKPNLVEGLVLVRSVVLS